MGRKKKTEEVRIWTNPYMRPVEEYHRRFHSHGGVDGWIDPLDSGINEEISIHLRVPLSMAQKKLGESWEKIRKSFDPKPSDFTNAIFIPFDRIPKDPGMYSIVMKKYEADCKELTNQYVEGEVSKEEWVKKSKELDKYLQENQGHLVELLKQSKAKNISDKKSGHRKVSESGTRCIKRLNRELCLNNEDISREERGKALEKAWNKKINVDHEDLPELSSVRLLRIAGPKAKVKKSRAWVANEDLL